MKLTDDDIDEIRRDNSARAGDAYATMDEVHAMAVELRQLRQLRDLLAMPWRHEISQPPRPYGPQVIFRLTGVDHVVGDRFAIELGAALIRAALKAQEQGK